MSRLGTRDRKFTGYYSDEKLLELLEEFRKIPQKKKNLKSPRVIQGKNRDWIINEKIPGKNRTWIIKNKISNRKDNSTTRKIKSNKGQRKRRTFNVSREYKSK